MYRLLHIEADAAAHDTVVQALADSPLPFVVEQVADLARLAPPFDGAGIDALLLGTRGQASPLANLARCREWFPGQPIIVLTDKADLAFARAAFRAGAQDVVQLHDRALAVLSRILLYAIERAGAEARSRLLHAEAAGLRAMLDGLLAGVSDTLLQTDPAGTILRASPGAAALIGLELPPPPGTHLAERVEAAGRDRLQSFIAAADSAVATFGFKDGGNNRLLELQPLALTGASVADMRLFRVSELAADFAADPDPAATPAAMHGASSAATVTAKASSGHASQPAQGSPAPTRRGTPVCQGNPSVEPKAEAPVAPATVTSQATSPLVQLRGLAEIAKWHVSTTAGNAQTLGFLGADHVVAQTLNRLAVAAREDFEVALGVDSLRIKGWQDLARTSPDILPQRLLVEVSYGTVASRPHYERLLAEIAASPAGLAERFLLVLQGVPKGIYVPTLAKAIRAMGSGHGKPALQLPDLDTDYRNLVLGQLTLMVVAIDDLKRALARDAKQVAAFLARAQSEGCRSIVRGATGPLAEALRTRLGIDMTVAA